MVIEFNEGVIEIGLDKKTIFFGDKTVQGIICPKSLEMIYRDTFAFCSNLKKVILNEGLKLIGNRSFYGCGIKDLEIPSTVKVLNNGAFENCPDLEEVIFKDGCNTIKSRAFAGCTKLKRLVLPSTLTKIAPDACENCPNLTEIIFEGDPKKVDGYEAFIKRIGPAIDEIIEDAQDEDIDGLDDFNEDLELFDDILDQ